MNETEIGKRELTVGEKKAIDILVNGLFVFLGCVVILYPGLSDVNFRMVVGLISIYIGVRFIPRLENQEKKYGSK